MVGLTTFASGIEWIVSDGLTDYPSALQFMEARAIEIAAGNALECVWLLEHPPLYTAGTSADPAELREPLFPVFVAGRGGRYTYHGPGQRVVYLMLDLGKRGRDVRRFVCAIEDWIIATFAQLDLPARREAGRIGIWTDDPELGEAKIGAIGIRIRKWVSLHGFSINIDPALEDFSGIIPCGIPDFGVTSLRKLGNSATIEQVDAALQDGFDIFLTELNVAQCA